LAPFFGRCRVCPAVAAFHVWVRQVSKPYCCSLVSRWRDRGLALRFFTYLVEYEVALVCPPHGQIPTSPPFVWFGSLYFQAVGVWDSCSSPLPGGYLGTGAKKVSEWGHCRYTEPNRGESYNSWVLAGLTVIAVKDASTSPIGIKVSGEEMVEVNITRKLFHGERTYTIGPQ